MGVVSGGVGGEDFLGAASRRPGRAMPDPEYRPVATSMDLRSPVKMLMSSSAESTMRDDQDGGGRQEQHDGGRTWRSDC